MMNAFTLFTHRFLAAARAMLSGRGAAVCLGLFFSVAAAQAQQTASAKPTLGDLTVQVEANSDRVDQLFASVSSQTGFQFTYTDSTIGQLVIDQVAEPTNLRQLLTKVATDHHLSFKQVDEIIYVRRETATAQQTAPASSAPAAKISGTIYDETGQGLPGVTILIAGTLTGTSSDYDGSYTIEAEPTDSLVFQFIGYKSQTIYVGSQTQIDVTLEPDTEQLEEVVVLGYGSVRKEDSPGSISTVSGETISQMNLASPDQGLQGAVSGVQVSSAGGVPGGAIKIQIRGTSSLAAGTSPLFIIDGVPISAPVGSGSTFNPMATINPADIESFTVLKDAAATAIYGSRGANGVIIITTKRGEAGVPTTNVSFTAGVSQAFNLRELAGSEDWFDYLDLARDNAGISPITDDQIVVGLGSILHSFDQFSDSLTRAEAVNINTDWYDQALRMGSFMEANASYSGATEQADYFVAVNYRGEESVFVGSLFQRAGFRSNINAKLKELPGDGLLKTGVRLAATYLRDDEPLLDEGFRLAASENLPWMPLYNSQTGLPNGPASGYNTLFLLDQDNQFQLRKTYRILASTYLDMAIPFVEGLSIRSELGVDLHSFVRNEFTSFILSQQGSTEAIQLQRNNLSYNLNYYLTYNRSFGPHAVNVVVGEEVNRITRIESFVRGRGVDQRRDITDPGTISESNLTINLAGTLDDAPFVGRFGRASYKFDDRYLINGSFRYDGSAKFAPDRRFSTFSSVAVAWFPSAEDFWFGGKAFNDLKLRASYGEVGNDQIPSNLSQDSYADWPLLAGETGLLLRTVGNTSLGWESTTAVEVGADFGLFKNRVSGGLSYYRQNVRDMLFPAPLPLSASINPYGGQANQWTNFANMDISGFEVEVRAYIIDSKDWSLTTDFNLTLNRAIVRDILVTDGIELDYLGLQVIEPNVILREDDPLAMYSLPIYAGRDEQGRELIQQIGEDGQPTGETVLLTPASAQTNRFVDPQVTTQPTYWGGITNTLGYKGLELSAFLMFQGGNYILDLQGRDVSYPNRQGPILQEVAVNSYESSLKPGTFPAPNANDGAVISDRFLHRGDFAKLRMLRLAYTLPTARANTYGFQSATVFVMVNNLFTLTGFPGYDPETIRLQSGGGAERYFEYNLGQSIVNRNSIYPQVRTYSAGVQLSF